MADVTLEDLGRAHSIPDIAKKLGRDRATIYSWTKEGIRGVRLKTLLVGGRRFVLPEYVEEFVGALSAVSDFGADERDRTEAVEVAESELDALLG